jgi:hypothetical protein
MNCYFCHRPCDPGPVSYRIGWSEPGYHGLTYVEERAHAECVEAARRAFVGQEPAAKGGTR